MAKNFRIGNVNAVSNQIIKVFDTVKQQKKTLDEIGRFSRDRIVSEARKGFSLEQDKRNKFKPLKESTIRTRESLERNKRFDLDPDFFKATRANVTLTGQLLDAFLYRIGPGLVSFFFSEKPRRVIYEGDENKNDKVYDNLQGLGYGFIGLDERSQKRVVKIVIDEFRRTIKNLF